MVAGPIPLTMSVGRPARYARERPAMAKTVPAGPARKEAPCFPSLAPRGYSVKLPHCSAVVSACAAFLAVERTLVHSPAASGGLPLMAYRCEVCGKEPWVGKQVSFSHKRSSRRWLPNIQRVRVRHGSNSRRIRVCTSCIKAGKVEKA